MTISPVRGIVAIGSVIAVVAVIMSGWFTVEQGQRGVVLRMGALHSIAEPGFHFKIPFMDSVYDMEVRTQKLIFKTVVSYSRDIQQSTSVVTINYELPPGNVADVFTKLGRNYAERVIWPAVNDRYKEVFGRYTAAELVSDRQRIGDEVHKAIADDVSKHGVRVSQVQIENIDFSDDFEKAIEAAVKAKAAVTEAEQVLRRREIEAQTRVVEAKAQADAARIESAGRADAAKTYADGEAYKIRVEGVARADYITSQGNALAGNPNVIEYLKAERWDGKLPVTMLPSGALPMIGVK